MQEYLLLVRNREIRPLKTSETTTGYAYPVKGQTNA